MSKQWKCNIALQWDITKSKLHQMYRICFIEMDLYNVIKKIWGVMQQCVYETKICDICDLQKRLMQSLVDFGKNVIEAAIARPSEIVHACWWRTL